MQLNLQNNLQSYSHRLKKVLSFSILREQFGFLRDKQIHEAMKVTRGWIHTYKSTMIIKNKSAMIIKLDML